MSDVDLVIHGGQVVSSETITTASIAIRGEHIVAIGADELMPPARARFDASGLHILPGAIDSHVHFRTPGYSHKEDWATGSAAAACGGVTTVFEMPNTDPPTGSLEALALKQEAARRSQVDYGIYGLLDENNIDQLEALIDAGVTGFKCFMGNTFGNLPAPSDGAILEGFEILAKRGIRCTVHAENPSIMARRQSRMEAVGRADRHAHLAARPEVCEIEAIGRAITFAEWTGARLHIAHHSAADSLYLLRDAKRRGVDVTAETCPQYLLLNTGDMTRLGSVLRVNPPIRDARHNGPLWDALVEGVIDMIATDHAPHTPEEKRRERIWDCDCGFPGVETQMSLMLTEINRGRARLTDYVRWSAVNPAKAWGIFGLKGILQPGAHADIVMVDLAREAVIADDRLHSRSKLTPWNARPVKGVPLHTLVRGRFVMRDSALVAGNEGWGRSVNAIQAMPKPAPRNVDKTMRAIIEPGPGRA
ncbi:MAG: dihydroorotase family protein [Burkholderiales bacterium]